MCLVFVVLRSVVLCGVASQFCCGVVVWWSYCSGLCVEVCCCGGVVLSSVLVFVFALVLVLV